MTREFKVGDDLLLRGKIRYYRQSDDSFGVKIDGAMTIPVPRAALVLVPTEKGQDAPVEVSPVIEYLEYHCGCKASIGSPVYCPQHGEVETLDTLLKRHAKLLLKLDEPFISAAQRTHTEKENQP